MCSLESLIVVLASAAIPLLALHLWAFVYPTGRIKYRLRHVPRRPRS
jgi:hypothetical protein